MGKNNAQVSENFGGRCRDEARQHQEPKVAGQTSSRTLTPEEASAEADESADIERTERALIAELHKVAERRRSMRMSQSMCQPIEEAIEDEEPEATVEEISCNAARDASG